jgi:hypothetical protein
VYIVIGTPGYVTAPAFPKSSSVARSTLSASMPELTN